MEMPEAIAKAFKEGEEVVVESFIKGRELTCGMYFDGKEIITLPLTEITTENEFFDFEAKYNGQSNEITPAPISEELTDKIKAISKEIYQRLGMKGIGRADYLVTDADEVFVIEVNTNPGMSDESIVPQQINASEKDLTTVLTEVISQHI